VLWYNEVLSLLLTFPLALTMKLDTGVVHFLVERTRYNKLRFKDSEYEFENLELLIRKYCVYQLGNNVHLHGLISDYHR